LFVFIIGIDPHKGSHTAAVNDRGERLVGEMALRADRRQRERLLRWAQPFMPRMWAIEGAAGVGALLAITTGYGPREDSLAVVTRWSQNAGSRPRTRRHLIGCEGCVSPRQSYCMRRH
jgi:hypothetical protein